MEQRRELLVALAVWLVAVGAGAAENVPAWIVFRLATAQGQLIHRSLAVLVTGLGLAGLDRRGLLQIGGDGLEVGIAEVLQAVLHRLGHGARSLGLAFDMTGAQIRDDFVVGPGADTTDLVGGDVGRVPAAQRATGQGLAAVRRHQQVTRGMAGVAVRQAIDQVIAAVDLGRFGRVRGETLVAMEQRVPTHHRGANAEREVQRGFLVRGIDWLHFVHEVVVEFGDIAVGHLRIRGVWHRRVQVGAIGRDPIPHRTGELLGGVVADARGFRRRDVGREDGAHRRTERVAPGEWLAARCRVARHAVGGDGQAFAGGRLTIERLGGGCGGRGHRQRNQSCKGIRPAFSLINATRHQSFPRQLVSVFFTVVKIRNTCPRHHEKS
ncbi:hypothetical protein D3C73_899450 [compost metagenome]